MSFNFFLLYIFADMSAIQALFPFLAAVKFQKVVTAVAILGVLAQSQYFKHAKRCLSSKQGYILMFLVFCMLASIPLSIWPTGSFQFIAETFWKTLVTVVLTLAYIKSDDALRKIIWVYILAIGMLAIITVSQAGSGRMEINNSYDPNDTALQFLMVLPFVFWELKASYGFKRTFLISIGLILLVGIVWTQSRGGFVGLLALLAVTMAQMKYFEKKGFVKIVFFVSAILMIVVYFGSSAYRERISSILNPSEDYNVTSVSGRVAIWKRGIEIMLNNPFFGIGVANFTTADGRLYASIGSRWNTAHNSFILIGAELGIPGLIAFVYLIWSSVRGITKIAVSCRFTEGNRRTLTVSNSLIGSWVAYIVGGSFLSAAYISPFYFLVSLSIAFMTLQNVKNANAGSRRALGRYEKVCMKECEEK